MENVIATREGPVVIDAEAFIQPLPTAQLGGQAGDPLLRETFLVTGLLAFSQIGIDGSVRDVGGLRGDPGTQASPHQRDWTDVNTDEMRLAPGTGRPPETGNLLVRNGKPEPPERYPGELAEGFTSAYRFVLAHREALLEDIRARFAGARSRLVLRPSNLYAGFLLKLTTPKLQRQGFVAGILIDSLNQVFQHAKERPPLWPLAAEERQALERLDLPVFSVEVTATTISAQTGERVEGHLAVSGIDAVATRLRHMDEAGLDRHLSALARTLDTVGTGPAGAKPGGRPLSPAGLLVREATAIGNLLIEEPHEGTEPADLDLYTGATGVALFLAALAHVTGEERYRRAAWSTVQPVAEALRERVMDGLAPDGALGACTGLGSVAYGCTVAGRLLDDAAFIDLAAAAAELISDQIVEGDNFLDVSAGSAGAILALLTLEAVTGLPVRSRAEACARRLLQQQREGPDGGAAWPGPDGLMLAGFAHGASGIACALARLHAVTGEPALRAAVARAQAYERTLFAPDEQNWPGLLPGGPDRPPGRLIMRAWCHGAPGVALARALCLGTVDGPDARRDLEAAISATIGARLSGPDHLCCGTMGRVDVILTVGRILGRETLVSQAEEWVVAIVQHATAAGGYVTDQQLRQPRPHDAGLFRGQAGIGYQLLRTAFPDRIPSVLAFEPINPDPAAEVPR